MKEQSSTRFNAPDSREVLRLLARIVEQSGRLMGGFLERQADGAARDFNVIDPGVLMKTVLQSAPRAMAHPLGLAGAQFRFWKDYTALWMHTGKRMLGMATDPIVVPEPGDRRFKDDEWQDNLTFDFIKQAYLLAARSTLDHARYLNGDDEHTARKLQFYARQLVDAMAPTNFALTNPQVIRRTLETGGLNVLRGLSHLLADLERGRGRLRITMTDESRFRLGENVATTPGKIVWQNELMQLIQYAPTTQTVYRRPLLIVPPWINKYYILDLRPKNSFIRWAVAAGHTVFVISWVNPDASLAAKSFDDYMREGPLAALDAMQRATGESEFKVIGYCLGGTLLAAALAWLEAHGDTRIRAATLLAAMTDFSEPGDLGVFIDAEQLALIDKQMARDGYFEGRSMAEAFNLLRANDLIWSFVVNNYLLGNEPFAFDLLYWNSDSTRMPREMHGFYLHKMYLENQLCRPGGLTLDGTPIDLGVVRVPTYVLATRDDHIAPWKSSFAVTGLFNGPVRFVLGASGHIAGVVNPPAAGKYGYWTNPARRNEPDAWLADAEFKEGSWWLDWKRWVARYNGKKGPARHPGDGALDVIEDAPGSYVKRR